MATAAPSSQQAQVPARANRAGQVKTIREYLLAQQSQIEAALPNFLTPTRFLRAAFTEFSQTPDLYECSTRSLLGALIQCAQLGLEPNRTLGHVYLVPFKNRRRGTVEVTVIVGYRGLLALARRSGEVSTINAHLVLVGDEFHYHYGTDPVLVHKPSDEPRVTWITDTEGKRVSVERPVTHYYAVVRMRDGQPQFLVMNLADVEAHRDRYAHVTPDSAWTTNFDEMALKTVLRRLCRLLPMSTDFQRAMVLDAQTRHGEPQNLAALVTGEDDDDEREDVKHEGAAAAAPDAPAADAPAADAPAEDAPIGTPPESDTEAARVKGMVVALMDKLKLKPVERTQLIREHAGVEALGRATLDGATALHDALKALEARRDGPRT